MADYIYLIQNRLSSGQRGALEAVREAARAQAMPVFLVGGAVRDLTSGSPVRDLDFAVQGDAGALRTELESRGGTVSGENQALSSLYLTFAGGVRVEVGPTLQVSWPTPGKAETHTSSILEDLRRRDFTANAMAVSLNEGSYGLLLDPLNGMADIENRELRLVSPYGFIEQPALLLRAARLSERLGWVLEERTATRYANSKEEKHLEAISQADRGYELEEILHEEDPVAILQHMESEGWQPELFAALRPELADQAGLDQVRDALGQIEALGLHPDPSAVTFPYLTAKLKEADRQALKRALPRQGFVRQVETMEARGKELASELTSKASAQPSESWKLLMRSDPEVVLHLVVHSRSGAVQNKLKAFLRDWPGMRQRIPYAVMQEMRISPDLPGYAQLLEDLFFALMDGKLDTVEATRAFLEPFSPPAPPQVATRRRPAKATRGRARKAAAVADAEEVVADEEATTSAEAPESTDDQAGGPEASATPSAPPQKQAKEKPKSSQGRAGVSAKTAEKTHPAVQEEASPSVSLKQGNGGVAKASPARAKAADRPTAKKPEPKGETAKKDPKAHLGKETVASTSGKGKAAAPGTAAKTSSPKQPPKKATTLPPKAAAKGRSAAPAKKQSAKELKVPPKGSAKAGKTTPAKGTAKAGTKTPPAKPTKSAPVKGGTTKVKVGAVVKRATSVKAVKKVAKKVPGRR